MPNICYHKTKHKKSKSIRSLSQMLDGFKTIIGKGGFGEVYLGTLQSGERVAVKKLSLSSNQGYKEFKSKVRWNN